MSLYTIIIHNPNGPQVSNLFCFLKDAQEHADELSKELGVKTSVEALNFELSFTGGQFMEGVVTRYNKETVERLEKMNKLDNYYVLLETLPCEAQMHEWWNKEKANKM